MIYIYDILLNFCDVNLVYDFYEWSNNDNIENIKKIKLVHVSREDFDSILNHNGVVDGEFLGKIFKTCEVYTCKKVKVLNYCVLFSDGERVIATEFNEKGVPIYKSKLLLDEEEEIAILASNLVELDIDYKVSNRVLENRFFTRNEMVVRKYLQREIEDSYRKKNFNKLKFLYGEYFDDVDCSTNAMVENLLGSMKNSLDDKHINMYKLLRLTNKKKQV